MRLGTGDGTGAQFQILGGQRCGRLTVGFDERGGLAYKGLARRSQGELHWSVRRAVQLSETGWWRQRCSGWRKHECQHHVGLEMQVFGVVHHSDRFMLASTEHHRPHRTCGGAAGVAGSARQAQSRNIQRGRCQRDTHHRHKSSEYGLGPGDLFGERMNVDQSIVMTMDAIRIGHFIGIDGIGVMIAVVDAVRRVPMIADQRAGDTGRNNGRCGGRRCGGNGGDR